MSDNWTDRLSEYLDETLADAERAGLEAHLQRCTDCAAVLKQLRSVVFRAEVLEDRPPTKNLWPEIAQRIKVGPEAGITDIEQRRSRNRRTLSVSVPQLLAASVALMMMSGGAVWFSLSGGQSSNQVAVAPDLRTGTAVAVLTGFTTTEYDEAVAELQEILGSAKDRLDSGTVRVLEESLATIDRAINEARAAIDADPESDYLNSHLAATMKRKVQLLKRAATIAAAAA